mmetsp:Transcript_11910/g.23642  ORF Transcript_11910/g.23642 Transcript_11910/m.23642 type:complete len:200 (-) Transcript_11910:79-678(-)
MPSLRHLIFSVCLSTSWGLSLNDLGGTISRRRFGASSLIATTLTASRPVTVPVYAEVATTADTKKLVGISDESIAAAVERDLVENQFLVTGKLTRAIYDEGALFTDEIDTYTLEKWQIGTSRLFVGSESHVQLVGPVKATPQEVSFRFDEVLAFNVPLHPKVKLTGRLVLTRSLDTGLIINYREYWDQSVSEVLKSARI